MIAAAYRSWLKYLFRASGRRWTFVLRRTRPLCLEPLEDRTLLSTFFVVNTGDSGDGIANYGDLRYCIMQANAAPGANVIDFALPGSGTQTIHLQSALPVLTNSVTLDGWSQGGAGYMGAPLVELDGSEISNGFGDSGSSDGEKDNFVRDGGDVSKASGLVIQASSCVVRGLAINNFDDYGLVVAVGSANDWVYGCYFGVTPDGLHAASNAAGGVYLGGTNTLLGTDAQPGTSANNVQTDAERNLISGNNGYGVSVAGSGNIIAGDLIGLGADGSTELGNAAAGVLVSGANNTIGGAAPGAGNVLSANVGSGIRIDGMSATGNVVQGNDIGTDASGMSARGNTGDGIVVTDGASDNTLGGSAADERNVISGNSAAGIALGRFTAAGEGNRVLGNYIGVNADGTAVLGNGFEGVLVNDGSSGEVIGGSDPGDGNVISGNGLFGLNIVNATNNTVQGNLIGVLPDGNTAAPNAQGGVIIQSTSLATTGNLIGGTTDSEGNLISGNNGPGVLLSGGGVTGNVVAGNRIGTTASGDALLGNAGDGVRLDGGASQNTIGGDTPGSGNVIAFNAKGVVVADDDSTGDSILGNSIFGNAGPGIDLGDDGPTANGTSPPGPNNFQPHPVLVSVVNGQLTGSLSAAADTTYRIELFASPASGPAWQGQTFLGSVLVTTSANGLAFFTTSVSLPAGEVVTATATDLATGDTSEFSAGPPASVVAVSGSGQHATVDTDFADPLQVIVRDAYGNPLSGVLVEFAAPSAADGSFNNFPAEFAALSGGDSPSNSSIALAITDAAGVAVSPFFHAGTLAGSYTVTATVEGVSVAEFALTNDPGPASDFVISVPSQTSGVSNTPLTVRVVDAFGNTVSDYRGTIHFASSDPNATLSADYTFTAEDAGVHRFDDLILRSGGTQTITVSDGNGLLGTATVNVTNAPPNVAFGDNSGSMVENAGQPLSLTGSFTDPDSDQWVGTVNYGDGSGVQQLVLAPDHSFLLNHVYQQEGNYTVTVTITDGGGASGFVSVPIEVFDAGLDLTQIGQVTAPPGGSGTLSESGISATLFRDASDDPSAPASLLAAPVSASEVEQLDGGSAPGGSGTLMSAFDIRSVDLTAKDQVVVTFQYPPGGDTPALVYFDKASHSFKPVLGSSLQPDSIVIDSVHHTVTLTLDASSTPRLGDLTGTVFVVEVPPAQPSPPASPPTVPPSPAPLPPPASLSAGESSATSGTASAGTTSAGTTTITPVPFLATSLPSGSVSEVTPPSSTAQASSNNSSVNGISAFSPFVLIITGVHPGAASAEAGAGAETNVPTPSVPDVLPLLNRLPRVPVPEESPRPPDSGPNAVLSPSRAGLPEGANKPERPAPPPMPPAPPAADNSPPLGFQFQPGTPAALPLATASAKETEEGTDWFDDVLSAIFDRLPGHANGQENPVQPAVAVLALCAGLVPHVVRPQKKSLV